MSNIFKADKINNNFFLSFFGNLTIIWHLIDFCQALSISLSLNLSLSLRDRDRADTKITFHPPTH